jgi:hypothetical protein
MICIEKKGHLTNILEIFYMCNPSTQKRHMNNTFGDLKNPIFDLILYKKFWGEIITYVPLI